MKKQIFLAMLAVGLTQGASAGFVDESASNPFAENRQIRVIGSGQLEDLPGFARDIPLHEALAQIIPRAYSVRSRGVEALATTRVSWQGGKSWKLVLTDVLEQVPALQAEIDTSSKIVTLSVIASDASSTVAATDDSSGVTVHPVAAPAKAWEVRQSDLTVRTAMQRWADEAQWQLVWDLSVDYPIAADATIESPFEVAVETLTRSLQGADMPPKAIIYRGNRVVRIVSRGME